jgi:hypothetical protein
MIYDVREVSAEGHANGPNEKELSYRWRERALIGIEVFS